MIPEPYRHLNWMLRLATSRKLSSSNDYGVDLFHSYYFVKPLRVRDRSVERSKDGDIVDFKFMREAVTDIYKTQTFADSNKKIPRVIENMIDSSFYQE